MEDRRSGQQRAPTRGTSPSRRAREQAEHPASRRDREQAERRHPRRALRRWLVAATLSYVTLLTVNRSQVLVAGPSMEPSLWAGDRLLTVPALPGLLRVGQVVVVRDPLDADHLVIKRIAAIDGDQLTVLGDAADRSTDSRHWGPVPRASVRRIAIARWPDLLTSLRTFDPAPDDPAPDEPGRT